MDHTKETTIVEMPLGGLDPKDIEVSVSSGILTISGHTKKEKEVDEKGYYRKEVRTGSFFRQMALPPGVDEDKLKAECEDGVLRIMCPVLLNAPKKQPVTIEI
ncbi:MAG TPA: heat-shock protein Hsp20 [Candidatus Magasanikbacteria bacterium]|nr:heat-shock protein Hsp20 [Candidatus Magasanikbacteria bacterium]